MFGVKVVAGGAGLNGAAGEVAPMAFTSLTLFGFLTAPAKITRCDNFLHEMSQNLEQEEFSKFL
jgi:hypothetical protein